MFRHLIYMKFRFTQICRETQQMCSGMWVSLWLWSGKDKRPKRVFCPCLPSCWSFLLVHMTPDFIYAFSSGHNSVIGQKWSLRRSVQSPFCHSVKVLGNVLPPTWQRGQFGIQGWVTLHVSQFDIKERLFYPWIIQGVPHSAVRVCINIGPRCSSITYKVSNNNPAPL